MNLNATFTVSNQKHVPNIPSQKNALKSMLDETELKYAQALASAFLSNNSIVDSFINASTNCVQTSITTSTFYIKSWAIVPTKEIVEYATLIIFGSIFTKESCPDILEVTLKYAGTEDLVPDPVPPLYWGSEISDLYQITLTSQPLA